MEQPAALPPHGTALAWRGAAGAMSANPSTSVSCPDWHCAARCGFRGPAAGARRCTLIRLRVGDGWGMAGRARPRLAVGHGGAGGGRALGARCRGLCLAAVVATAVAAAGCGGGLSGEAGAVPRYEVLARTIPGLGKVITDGHGYTLYMYVPDHRVVSRCTGFCARQWPPLVLPRGITRPRAGPGVRAALLGTVRRGDGMLQETYNGWPLYLWQGDYAPGQATGQAENMGLWYALAVTGAVDKGTPD